MLDENETVEMIKTINDEHQMVVDPHTAVGIGAVRKLGLEKNCVVLSTAPVSYTHLTLPTSRSV